MSEVGKAIGDNIYFHLSAVETLRSGEHRALINDALGRLAAPIRERVNVAKVNVTNGRVSLLEYADFDSDPFPVLKGAWVSSRTEPASDSYRSYVQAANPPILHRKELLVGSEHPYRAEWSRVTRVAEDLGLFEESKTIGFLLNWERAIERKGYRLVGTEFHPIGNDISTDGAEFDLGDYPQIQRHLTALARTTISAPVQLLLRCGLLAQGASFFDYGCGRGDDIQALTSTGFNASGWDPHFAPSNSLPEAADVVNLGFVINVIEDPAERVEAIHKAFRISTGVMSIGVMLYGPERTGKPFGDGFVTSRGTFQKYFAQEEIKDYLEQVLHQEAFMVAPGIAFVFSNKSLEQRFIASRYRTKSVATRLLIASRRKEQKTPREPRPPRERRDPNKAAPTVPKISAFERRLVAARPVLDAIWKTALELGRYPEVDELPEGTVLGGELTLRRAVRLLDSSYDAALLAQAREARMDDLRLYFAMQHFSRRPRYKQLEARLQRDVSAFFRDYATAYSAGLGLLKDAADSLTLLKSCTRAAENGFGWLEGDHSLQVHVDMVDRLPVVLRTFVSCGLVLAGGMSEASLVKIHITSGKLTLMEFDGFATSPLPQMTRRIKVNLRALTYDLFEYGAQYPKPVLYRKSRYLHEDSAGYAEQLAFDEALEASGVLGSSEFGPPPDSLGALLDNKRLMVQGMELVPSKTIPNLNELCGATLTYRHLIECGETQHRLGLANLPRRPETYNALHGLATRILDPVIEYFGSIKLTYGFCSIELARNIKSRVAPALDQHAAEEVKASGLPICARGGAACDFIVEDENMREVADWIIDNLPFDRLYFYGSDRPLHVSWAPNCVAEAYEMVKTPSGRQVPRRFQSHPDAKDS